MREWLTIIIVLLILGVLLDGWRRMRQAKRQSIRMNLKANKFDDADPVDNFTSELPNGGARVVSHRNLENARELTRHLQDSYGKKKKVTRPRPAETSLNLDEDVPMLMESVDDDQRYHEPSLHHDDDDFEPEDILMTGGRRDSGRQSSLERDDDRYADEDDYEVTPQLRRGGDDNDRASDFDTDHYDTRSTARGKHNNAPYSGGRDYDSRYDDDAAEDDFDPAAYDPDDFDPDAYEVDEADDYDSRGRDSRAAPGNPSAHADADDEPDFGQPEEVVVINVMAVGHERFYGPDLLDVLDNCGLHHGDMDIFHRYEHSNGDGHLLFSLANMVVPGTFDLHTIDEFETPGVSLFMTLPMQANSMEAFNVMADTAKALATGLGGEMKDEQRSVMTAQTLEHCRQRILEFERKRLSRG